MGEVGSRSSEPGREGAFSGDGDGGRPTSPHAPLVAVTRPGRLAGGLGAVLAASSLMALAGRGGWGHQMLSLGALLWVGGPLFLIVGIALWRRHRAASLISGALLAVLVLQLGLGLLVMRWDVHAAKRYCESLLPVLDMIHAEAGAYPPKLGDDPRLPPAGPWFDSTLVHYYSDGATFSLEVSNPSELFGGYRLHHDRRRWEEWVD